MFICAYYSIKLDRGVNNEFKHTCTKAIFTLFYNKGVDKVFNVSFISSLKVVTNIHTSYTMNVLFWNKICTTEKYDIKLYLKNWYKQLRSTLWISWCLDRNWISCKDEELQQYWYSLSRYLHLKSRLIWIVFSMAD